MIIDRLNRRLERDRVIAENLAEIRIPAIRPWRIRNVNFAYENALIRVNAASGSYRTSTPDRLTSINVSTCVNTGTCRNATIGTDAPSDQNAPTGANAEASPNIVVCFYGQAGTYPSIDIDCTMNYQSPRSENMFSLYCPIDFEDGI